MKKSIALEVLNNFGKEVDVLKIMEKTNYDSGVCAACCNMEDVT